MLTPLFLLFGVRSIGKRKPSLVYLILFINVGMLSSLIKHSFLPIFVFAFIYIAKWLFIRYGKSLFSKLGQSLKRTSNIVIIGLALLSVVGIGAFFERYATNYLTYGDITVACDEIHPLEDCEKQPIFNRNTTALESQLTDPVTTNNLEVYTRTQWLPGMIETSLTATSNLYAAEEYGPVGVSVVFVRQPAIPFLLAMMWVFSVASVAVLAYSWRELKKLPFFWFLSSVLIFYTLVLLLYVNFPSYSEKGQAFAIQPRYLLLLLPILIAYVVQATSIMIKQRLTKLIVLLLVVSVFTQGGGIMTYIYRSDENWYWQRRQIIDANMKIQEIIDPIIKSDDTDPL
jgi:hypothetical protein